MKEVGGYFSFEINRRLKDEQLHLSGLFLNSGRNALEYILSSLPKIDCLWIPYFTCDVILEPLSKLNITYKFYSINENLEVKDDIQLLNDEYLLFTNYYGIKDAYVNILAQKYGSRLIVDNAQALYTLPIADVKTFYSPRKFVGIPDGGIVYMENGLDSSNFEVDLSYNRLSHLFKRIDLGAEAAYADFRENSKALSKQPIKRISTLSKVLFSSIDFKGVADKRINNFLHLHQVLSASNQLQIQPIESFACPMVYPYYTDNAKLKKKLIENKIFVATYWPNVFKWCDKDTLEYKMADRVIAIPIDQRYGEREMNDILEVIKN